MFIEKCQKDVWGFMLGTKSRIVFMFSAATLSKNGKWLHLNAFDDNQSDVAISFTDYRKELKNVIVVSGRGVDVLYDSIEWITEIDS